MKEIVNTSFKELIDNIDHYVIKFKDDGVLFFKQINLDLEQQDFFSRIFAEKINCEYVARADMEDHLRTFNMHRDRGEFKNKDNFSKDELFISWHLEHVQRPFPQVSATWNMTKFDCRRDVGKTGFVHVRNIYEKMPEDYKDFLNKSQVQHVSGQFPKRNCLQTSRITGETVIRLAPQVTEENLFSYENRFPSKDEIDFFLVIKNWYSDQIYDETSNQLWWEWSQGDLIVPDLVCMVHCVMGGFFPEQRQFYRQWIFEKESHYKDYA